MGSYPTHRTLAFVHAEQAGSTWSQRFFRTRHRLQADTFLKAEVAVDEVCGGDVGTGLSLSKVSSAGRVRLVPACGAGPTSTAAVDINLGVGEASCPCQLQAQGTRVRKCRNAISDDCFPRSIGHASCQMVGDRCKWPCGHAQSYLRPLCGGTH